MAAERARFARPPARAALLLFALAAAAPAHASLPLPAPETPGSHARYLEALRAAHAERAEALLSRYERRLAEAPGDVVAAIERCRFVAEAFADADGENPRHEACLADLEQRFAGDPAARVAAIEQRSGEEAREAAEAFLAEPPPEAQPAQLAAVHARLARVLARAEEEGAAEHAEQAMSLDPSLDLRVLVAKARLAEGDPERARDALLPGLVETPGERALERKAGLLADAGAFDAALSAFRELERRGSEPRRWADYGRALAAVGEIDAARAAFARLGEASRASAESRRPRFEFELAHGDAAAARAAYDALRDLGFWEDPLAIDRIRLLAAHPGAPWRWRDATGFAVVAIVAFGISLVPALWILPVAWAGLGRQRSAPAPGAFTLRHAWTVSAAYLLAEVLVALAMLGVFSEGVDAAEPEESRATARYFIVSSVASLAAVLLVVRGRARGLLARGAWSWRRTLATAGALGIALIGGETLLLRLAGVETADVGSVEMVRAVNATHGLAASLALVAGLVPLVEELVFRGVLLSAFARHLSAGWANFAQAALFGIVHVEPVAIPFAFAVGLAAGWATRRSGTLWPALALHALGNAAACVGVALAYD